MKTRVILLVGLALVAGCSSDPTTSSEYRDLEQRYSIALEQVEAADASYLALEQQYAGILDRLEAAESTSESGGNDPLSSERSFVVTTSEGEGCRWEGQSSQQTDDPTITILLGTLLCRTYSSDPRVSGEQRWQLKDPHYIHYTSTPNTGRFEASVILTTADGIWRGEGFGSDLWDEQGGLSTTFYAEYVGEGPYEGLIYREWGAKYPGSSGYQTSGYIQPAS